jgi:hypothetical protein
LPLRPDLDPVKARNIFMVLLAYAALLIVAIVGAITWGIV